MEDFLCNLGLQTYIDAFNENGFDDLEFLENLTSDDLKMFVINSSHIQQVRYVTLGQVYYRTAHPSYSSLQLFFQILDAVRKLKNDRIIRG